jgi:hypothetical protein
MRNSAVATCPALVVLLAFWEMLAIVPIRCVGHSGRSEAALRRPAGRRMRRMLAH